MVLFLQSFKVDWLVETTEGLRTDSAAGYVESHNMFFAVGVRRLVLPFTRAISRTDTFKDEDSIEFCCIVFQLKVFKKEELQAERFGHHVYPSMVHRMQDEYCASIEEHGANSSIFPNQFLPTLFTLRNEEFKIIAVMSSSVDDSLCGLLQEGAEGMNSVLSHFLVGKEEHGTFRFCGKEFRQDEDFRIHVTAKDSTE